MSAKLDELLRDVATATSDQAAADAVIFKLTVEDFVEAAKQLLATREVVKAARGGSHPDLDEDEAAAQLADALDAYDRVVMGRVIGYDAHRAQVERDRRERAERAAMARDLATAREELNRHHDYIRGLTGNEACLICRIRHHPDDPDDQAVGR